jgi:activator of 2-hydroxyglutaryl-CoA dehydratase
VEEDFAITGGIGKNTGVVTRIETELGVKALKPSLDTQIAGALGGALFARALEQKARKSK